MRSSRPVGVGPMPAARWMAVIAPLFPSSGWWVTPPSISAKARSWYAAPKRGDGSSTSSSPPGFAVVWAGLSALSAGCVTAGSGTVVCSCSSSSAGSAWTISGSSSDQACFQEMG